MARTMRACIPAELGGARPADAARRLFAETRTALSGLSADRRRHPFRLVQDPPRPGAESIGVQLAEPRTIRSAREALFGGGIVNPSEGRPPNMSPSAATAPRGRRPRRPAPRRGCAPGRRDRGRCVRRITRYPAHRHRRFGARPGLLIDALGRDERPLRGARSCPTSTARRSTRRSAGSIRRRPWSWSRPRPSPPPKR